MSKSATITIGVVLLLFCLLCFYSALTRATHEPGINAAMGVIGLVLAAK